MTSSYLRIWETSSEVWGLSNTLLQPVTREQTCQPTRREVAQSQSFLSPCPPSIVAYPKECPLWHLLSFSEVTSMATRPTATQVQDVGGSWAYLGNMHQLDGYSNWYSQWPLPTWSCGREDGFSINAMSSVGLLCRLGKPLRLGDILVFLKLRVGFNTEFPSLTN